jgi:hypothetical protein
MKIYGDEKPSLEDLVHHGVKGQKWGVRKSHPSTSEIHAARQRQEKRITQLHSAKTPQRKAAITKKLNTNEDNVTAARMTLGEKVTTTMLGGPVGLVVIARNNQIVKKTAAKTDQARKTS